MKNLPLVAVLSLFAVLSFSSCKKDYECTCNIKVPSFSLDSGGAADTTIKILISIDEASKKEAKHRCNGSEDAYKAVFGLFGTVDCEVEKE